jgi:hypothetical protein
MEVNIYIIIKLQVLQMLKEHLAALDEDQPFHKHKIKKKDLLKIKIN